MIYKEYVDPDEIEKITKNSILVSDDFSKHIDILNNNKFLGIQTKNMHFFDSDLYSLKTKIKYFSLVIDNDEKIIEIISKIKRNFDNHFIELKLKYNENTKEFIEKNINILKANKIVFVIDKYKKNIDNILVLCLMNRIYAVTENMAFCEADIKHCNELFESKNKGYGVNVNAKKDICKGCSLKKYCRKNTKNPKKIDNRYIKDIIGFMGNKNEHFTFRF